MSRTADYVRKTKETDITLSLELDGSGVSEIDTGIGFFDHMLEGFARHGFFDLSVKAEGDLIVDCHHTIEDTGIVLGNAIKKAVGDKKGIKRYGSCISDCHQKHWQQHGQQQIAFRIIPVGSQQTRPHKSGTPFYLYPRMIFIAIEPAKNTSVMLIASQSFPDKCNCFIFVLPISPR